jgi:hypothetical protein
LPTNTTPATHPRLFSRFFRLVYDRIPAIMAPGFVRAMADNSTGRGILIGMASAFGAAGVVALILVVIYFFQYTSRGRIFLDRLSRPGEYDDEQALLREEAEAFEEMDDMQRMEYQRAKGTAE